MLIDLTQPQPSPPPPLPPQTESDGNCLCHAASLGAWGVHDRQLLLRHAVRSFLADETQRAVQLLRRAWEGELGRHGVALEREDLDLEWATLAKQAGETANSPGAGAMDGGTGFAYLEAAHVYALAHVLRRPVVVFATDWVNARGRTLAKADEIAGAWAWACVWVPWVGRSKGLSNTTPHLNHIHPLQHTHPHTHTQAFTSLPPSPGAS